MTPPTVVALCGSLRDGSYTRIAARHALAAAADRGAQTELLDLRDFDLPLFDPNDEDAGDAPELRRRIRNADAIVLGTPMYHGSYSAPLKNAIDYCGFDEFEDKTVGLLGIAGGNFPLSALEHLRTVCRALDAWVLPYQAAVPRASGKFEDGAFTDQGHADRVAVLGERATEYADISPDPACFQSEENVGADD
ncbi:NADPH-dependent FMN reductase [Salinibaculum rarum]|uniref:NADPH-dependent FMN reductase n=1 Tax=Salinibaculum rarum TaxID=3058903 RepID=UPI00265E5316|nr:NAD(P)H-dependent oxidoreductase [Salinibaculum sp. KK48]